VQRRWETNNRTDMGRNPTPDVSGSVVALGLNAILALNPLGSLRNARNPLLDDIVEGVFNDQMNDSATQGKRGRHAWITAGPPSGKFPNYRGVSVEVMFDANNPAYVDFFQVILSAGGSYRQVGWLSLRPSLATKATLSMHNFGGKYAVSIEVALLQDMPDNESFLTFIQNKAIELGGRLHWGQANNRLTPQVVAAQYGGMLESWKRSLWQVSGNSTIFSNTFTRQRGLEPEAARFFPTGSIAQGDDMQPGEVLNPDQSISSANGQYTFVYQGDGNLVLYRNRDGQPLWASNTNGRPNGVCIMQGDGNLVIYDPNVTPVWASNTSQFSGSILVAQDDGNVVIYRPDGTPVWATNTVPTIPMERRLSVGNDTPSDQVVRVFNPGDLVMLVAVTAGEFLVRPGFTETWVFQNEMSQVNLTANGRPLGLANPGDTIVITQDDSVLVRNVTDSQIRARFYNLNDGLMWVTLPNGDQSIGAHQDFRYTIPPDLNSVKIIIQGQTFQSSFGDVVVFGA